MLELVRRRFDAVELELLWRRLISLVDEAAAALVRTSFSTLVLESHDFSCIVTDAAGESLVQATESIPSFIGTLPATVKHFLRFFPPDSLAPGEGTMFMGLFGNGGWLPIDAARFDEDVLLQVTDGRGSLTQRLPRGHPNLRRALSDAAMILRAWQGANSGRLRPNSSSSLGRYDQGRRSAASRCLISPPMWAVCYVQPGLRSADRRGLALRRIRCRPPRLNRHSWMASGYP
jgi:hypothetical protein